MDFRFGIGHEDPRVDTSISTDGRLTYLTEEVTDEGVAVLLTSLAVVFNSLHWALSEHQCWNLDLIAAADIVCKELRRNRPNGKGAPIPRPSDRAVEQAESLLQDLGRLVSHYQCCGSPPVPLDMCIHLGPDGNGRTDPAH